MKTLTADGIIRNGLNTVTCEALKSDDPVNALEVNLRRMAERIANGNIRGITDREWKRLLAPRQAPICECHAKEKSEVGIESLADMEDDEFAYATKGHRWQKLMGDNS